MVGGRRGAAAWLLLCAAAALPPLCAVADAGVELPDGWASGKTKDGRAYYYHPDNPTDVRTKPPTVYSAPSAAAKKPAPAEEAAAPAKKPRAPAKPITKAAARRQAAAGGSTAERKEAPEGEKPPAPAPKAQRGQQKGAAAEKPAAQPPAKRANAGAAKGAAPLPEPASEPASEPAPKPAARGAAPPPLTRNESAPSTAPAAAAATPRNATAKRAAATERKVRGNSTAKPEPATLAAEERKAARALAAEQEAKARSEAAEEERKNAPPPPGHLDPFGNPKEIPPVHEVFNIIKEACHSETEYVGGPSEGKRRCTKKIRRAVQRGSKVDQPGPDGATPLMSAVLARKPLGVAALLELGAELLRDAEGRTPLDVAAELGHVDVVSAMLTEHKTAHDPQELSPMDGLAPIHRAAAGETEGHALVVEEMLRHGVDVRLKSAEGQTPLDCVISQKVGNAATRRILGAGLKGLLPSHEQLWPQGAGAKLDL